METLLFDTSIIPLLYPIKCGIFDVYSAVDVGWEDID